MSAAMEPGPHGREEGELPRGESGGDAAAMEPGPHGREEMPPRFVTWVLSGPQWSPALTAGKRCAVLREGWGCQAAMEPGPHGREEARTWLRCLYRITSPQWSPALTAGKSSAGA